ncbi:MAG TPA: DUF4337 domain-containing protein, partial [Xanthobacteraceae bacterium]|nr:DUF4337 domain-containing protein [Xanthobacteraceae bacterium]
MPEAHEAANEAAEHLEEGHHESSSTNRRVALLIAVLALFLSFSETLGKSSQTNAISFNVQASDLWAFFQAKTIRATQLRVGADAMAVDMVAAADPALKAAQQKQIEEWRKTADRYDSDPQSHEGRKELAERAKHAEEKRDHALARYHNFEIASAAFQIAIVLASATVITGIVALAYLAGLLG